MRHSIGVVASLLCAGAIGWGTTARAQEAEYFQSGIPAPRDAFELKLGTEYTQGFGVLTPGQNIRDVAGAGIGFDLDMDYRVDPRWSVGLQGEYQEFENNTTANSAARGLAGNLGLTYHFAPTYRGDPWLRFGTGYRLFWNVDPVGGAPTTLIHGFELGKVTLGYDVRVDPNVAIAPMIGADADMFVWQDQNGANTALSAVRFGTFLFGGVQGRFDIGPTTATESTLAKRQ
ncbi:MAG TPA: hypothetical protein VGL81_16515 [Polyangiaceae bacterium]|jgi:hypothetical protein